MGFCCGSVEKNLLANSGDLGLIPGSERSPGEGIRYPLQYSYLGNPMDRGAWRATVHGVAKELDMTYCVDRKLSSYCVTLCSFQAFLRNSGILSKLGIGEKNLRNFQKLTHPSSWSLSLPELKSIICLSHPSTFQNVILFSVVLLPIQGLPVSYAPHRANVKLIHLLTSSTIYTSSYKFGDTVHENFWIWFSNIEKKRKKPK